MLKYAVQLNLKYRYTHVWWYIILISNISRFEPLKDSEVGIGG